MKKGRKEIMKDKAEGREKKRWLISESPKKGGEIRKGRDEGKDNGRVKRRSMKKKGRKKSKKCLRKGRSKNIKQKKEKGRR